MRELVFRAKFLVSTLYHHWFFQVILAVLLFIVFWTHKRKWFSTRNSLFIKTFSKKRFVKTPSKHSSLQPPPPPKKRKRKVLQFSLIFCAFAYGVFLCFFFCAYLVSVSHFDFSFSEKINFILFVWKLTSSFLHQHHFTTVNLINIKINHVIFFGGILKDSRKFNYVVKENPVDFHHVRGKKLQFKKTKKKQVDK